MSAQFIIEYGGLAVAIDLNHEFEVVNEAKATRYTAEGDAWFAAYKAGLTPNRCRVVDLYARNQTLAPVAGQEAGNNRQDAGSTQRIGTSSPAK